MRFIFLFLFGLCCALFFSFSKLNSTASTSKNHPPVVKFINPGNRSHFTWNSIVPYTIDVDDIEDGKSQYNEISSNEILVKVRYLPDSIGLNKYLLGESKSIAESNAILLMTSTTCFNCHTSKTQLIGPSFERIAKKYLPTAANIDQLSQRIIKGSTGIWGNTAMPSHPELKLNEAKQVAEWILKNNKNPDIYYLFGATGALNTRGKPRSKTGKEVYVLTASYTDHGSADAPKERMRGKSIVVLTQQKK